MTGAAFATLPTEDAPAAPRVPDAGAGLVPGAVVADVQDVSKLTRGKIGTVIKTAAQTKMNKTSVVLLTSKRINPKTGKARKWTTKFLCHDEHNITKGTPRHHPHPHPCMGSPASLALGALTRTRSRPRRVQPSG